jgi:VWFA-related protein
MRQTLQWIAAGALMLVAGPGTSAAPQQTSSRASDVTAILVDVVVRDRAGEPVTDLSTDELEILEDGVVQEIGSFTPIFKGPGKDAAAAPAALAARRAAEPAAASATPAAPSGTPVPGAEAVAAAAAAPGEVLALVFDRLTPEARELVHRAALAYADGEAGDKLMAVYGIDLGLVPYQAFTRDLAKVRKAVEEFGVRAVSQFGSTREQRLDLRDRLARAGAAQTTAEQSAGAGGGGAVGQAIAGTAGDVAFMAMQERMLQTFDNLERNQRGYSTANALMAVVSSMREIPGRKAIVFFSEGLSIPPDVQERFVAVVAAANRANVSIYSVDAAGLRTESTLKETREEIMAASQRTLSRNPTRDMTGEPMMAGLERNENNLRMDPHSGLGLLADQTGGLLVSNTNDFRRGLARVDSDLRNYYMLSYVPKNGDFDGKYRVITVRARRQGVTVQHRKGYYAVRAPAGEPVLAYEARALARLDRTPVPNAFPVRAAALRFPERDRPGLTPVIVEVPTAGLTFRPSPEDKSKYTSDVTVLVRIRDRAGEPLEKMSQQYELQGALDEVDGARKGEIIFYREIDLPPGVYSLETIVFDALSEKASVRFSTVEKPPLDTERLRLSSLLIVRRGEKVSEADGLAGNPLCVGEMLLYPNLGTPLKAGLDKELPFFFTAYLPTDDAATASLEVLQNARPLARVPLELDEPDSARRIQQVSRIPIDQLAPGTYELRVTVRQGSSGVTHTAPFRIVS